MRSGTAFKPHDSVAAREVPCFNRNNYRLWQAELELPNKLNPDTTPYRPEAGVLRRQMDLFSFIECANRTQSLTALFGLLVSCASDEGFSQVAYGALNYNEPVRQPEHLPPVVALNFPSDWCDRYFERKYHVIDPVVRRAPMLSGPFLWDQLADRCQLQPSEKLVLKEAREAGLKHGVSVPLFGPLRRVSVVSFASRFDDVDPLHHIGHLNTLAWQFHVAFAEIARPAENCSNASESMDGKVRLSERERDCLQWTAEGKSSWDIGMILDISENTVNFHLNKAKRKLGTTNRTLAVVKAIRLNLIELSGKPESSLPLEGDAVAVAGSILRCRR
jgi:DNA-binding CsgD family transcriptional regulator